MMKDKLAQLMLMNVITCNLLLMSQVESSRIVLNGYSSVNNAAFEGDIIDFKCTDTNFTEEHYIIWYRKKTQTQDSLEQIYRQGSLLTANIGQEALAYSLNNSTEFELTISITKGLDVGQWLHGNAYKCKALKINTNGTLFESGYNYLYVGYPPPAKYPLCVASGYQIDFVGQTVTLSCYSEPGNPRITIEWLRNNDTVANRSVHFQTNIRFALISFNYSFNLQQQHLEETYKCRVTWYIHNDNDVKTCTVLPTSSKPSTLIPTTKYNTTYYQTIEGKTTSQATMTSIDNLLYYIIAGSATGCAALLIVIICCIIRKKSSGRQKSNNDDEMQTKERSYGINNLVFDGPSYQDQTEILHSEVNTLYSKNRGSENKVPNYSQVLPKSVRNAKLQSAKQADSSADMGVVENMIYDGVLGPTESVSNKSDHNERLKMVEKKGPVKTNSTSVRVNQGNEKRMRDENIELQDSHVMEENILYAGF